MGGWLHRLPQHRGAVGLLSADNQPWLYPKKRHFSLLEATLAVWDELDAVGPRYYSAVQGERLWTLPNNLDYVLANMGMPDDVLRAPLPPEGPRSHTSTRWARWQMPLE